MTKNIKILGLCTVIAITGLSIENALTGHGIKGNKNLNPSVLATGSNSGSGSNSESESNSGNGSGGTKYCLTMENYTTAQGTPYKKGNQSCFTFTIEYDIIGCESGGSYDCTLGHVTTTGETCITPN